jgi:hypothetical protein
MPQTLARKPPETFKTLALHVEANAHQLCYQGIGQPLNFSQMQALRRPIEIADSQQFTIELANLGVSVRLTLQLHGRDYWVVVRQQRADRGDTVLKLISGYVPAHELNLPLLTALQELAEECLVESDSGWLGGRFAQTWLATPYADSLQYVDEPHFELHAQVGSTHPVLCADLPLLERPSAHVHLPTASLQLIYNLRLELPSLARDLSLFHADEQLEGSELITRLERQYPDLYLIALRDGRANGELYTLQQGQLDRASSDNLWLSEAVAERDGWLIRDERISWDDWLQQQRG